MNDIATLRLLNESAVRQHALACSKKFRAGKFTRVGEDFLAEVRFDVEYILRDMKLVRCPTQLHDPLPLDGLTLTTGALSDALTDAANQMIARIIQNKVQRQPTVGSTLGRTR